MDVLRYVFNVLPVIVVHLVFTLTETDAGCVLPQDLQSALWEYNYTDVTVNSEQSATLNIATTTMQSSISFNVHGTSISHWTCINSLNISDAQHVVVFKSDNSFMSGPPGFATHWLYLCMKLKKVTTDLFYFYLLSDILTDVLPNERIFSSDGNQPNDNDPVCTTVCQYTDSPKLRTLRRQGTNDVVPNDASLCEPCDSACSIESTEFPTRTTPAELYKTTQVAIMTSESNDESVTTPISSSTYLTESTKFERISSLLHTTAPESVTTPISSSTYLTESTKFERISTLIHTTAPEVDISTKKTTASTLKTPTSVSTSSTYDRESTQNFVAVITSTINSTSTDSIHRCLEDMDRFNTKWNRTAENTLITITCTGEYTGTVSRNCSSAGMWSEPDYTQCMSKSMYNLKQQLDKLLAGDSEIPLVSSILEELENITSANKELRTGDLVTASALLEDIAKYVTNHTDNISVDQLENFGAICNNLLEEKYYQSWEELNDKGTSGVTAVVKAVTEYTNVFHNVLRGEFSMLVKKENIEIEVGKTSSDEIIVPDRLQTTDSWITDSGTEMKLKKNMCSDLTGYSCTFYRNLSSLFPKYLLSNRKVLSFDGIYDVNSIIADVSIDAKSCLDYSVNLRFGHLLGNHSRPVCGFWDFNASNTVNGAWSPLGSLVADSSESYTICEYNHTTNFGVLMSPGRTPSPHKFPLSMISAIGCGVSILFLTVTIVVHSVLWRYVRNDRTKTLMNLCVALILSYVLFLAGIKRTETKAVCTAVAVALHYMFLTNFAMMLAEGILIVRMVIIVFQTKSIVHWLLPACWVVPGVFVGISAGVTKLNGYGNGQFCWLTLESNLIWAFIGPALLVILINFVIIVLTVHKMMTTKGLARKTLEEKSRIGFKSICVILPLFGVTWVLGAFSVNEDLVMFQYLFAIFNSLQGLLICLFHCFLNKEVRQGYHHYQRRRRANRSNIIVSTDTSNYDKHKRQQGNSNGISKQSKN